MSKLTTAEDKLLKRGFDWATDSSGYDPSWDEMDVLEFLKLNPGTEAKDIKLSIPRHRIVAAFKRLEAAGKLPSIPLEQEVDWTDLKNWQIGDRAYYADKYGEVFGTVESVFSFSELGKLNILWDGSPISTEYEPYLIKQMGIQRASDKVINFRPEQSDLPIVETCSRGINEAVQATVNCEQVTVITLWQPWATFIIKGIKCFETRSWATNHKGRILIHAAARKLNWLEVPLTALRKYLPDIDNWDFPTGAIVGEASLINCHRVEAIRNSLDGLEKLCGDYSDDRFAWELTNIKPLFIPNVKGKQGLWKYELTVNNEPSVDDVVLGETVEDVRSLIPAAKDDPDIPHWLTGRNEAEAKALIDSGFCYIGTVEQFEQPDDSCTNYGDWQFYYTQYFIEARCNGAVFNREESDKPDNELVNRVIATIKQASEQWGSQFGQQLELNLDNCEQTQNRENILLTEPPRQVDANGQLSIFWDDSEEPPDPDDFKTLSEYEEAYDKWAIKFPELNAEINRKKSQEIKNCACEVRDYIQLKSDPRRIGQIVTLKSGGIYRIKFADGFECDLKPDQYNEIPFSKDISNLEKGYSPTILGESFFKVGEQVKTSAPSYEGKIFTVATIYPTGMIGVVSNGNNYSFPANWLEHYVEKIESKSESIPLEQSKRKRPQKGCGSGYLKVREANKKRNAAKGKDPDIYYVYYYSYTDLWGKEIKSSLSVPREKISYVKGMIERKEHYVKICKFLGKSVPCWY